VIEKAAEFGRSFWGQVVKLVMLVASVFGAWAILSRPMIRGQEMTEAMDERLPKLEECVDDHEHRMTVIETKLDGMSDDVKEIRRVVTHKTQ
jgi:hypothetical protein